MMEYSSIKKGYYVQSDNAHTIIQHTPLQITKIQVKINCANIISYF